MDCYIDISILPNPEIEEAHLLNALFNKLHLALASSEILGQVGVSFPVAVKGQGGLGSVLRLHGIRASLESFEDSGWLGGMRGHLELSGIRAVPLGAAHWAVRRIQTKSNAARLRRRLMKRHSIDEAEAIRRIPDAFEKRLDLPWIQLRSASTDQTFRLFIKQEAAVPAGGRFNAYGLSESATVPRF
jgi:CRISPR-associated endonuclease Csy4